MFFGSFYVFCRFFHRYQSLKRMVIVTNLEKQSETSIIEALPHMYSHQRHNINQCLLQYTKWREESTQGFVGLLHDVGELV